MINSIQETAMRKFLLGDLPDEEVSRLEIEVLQNDERFEQMREMENSLVDDYVRNRLSRVEQEKFERHYLSSPIHAERVTFARLLIDQIRAEPITPKVANRSSILERLGLWPMSWQYALAAVILLVVVAAIWVFLQSARSHSESTQIKSEREPQNSQPKPTNEQATAVREENRTPESEKSPADKASDQKPPRATQPKKTERPEILAFTLSPVLVRSSIDQQVLPVTTDNQIVRLNLRVDDSEKRRFNATIRTVEGDEVWKQQNIKIHLDRTRNASIITSVPSRKLPVGDYILTLTAINSPASQEEINRYFFRVLRK